MTMRQTNCALQFMWDFIVGNHTDLISIYKVFEFEDPNRFLM